MDTIQNWTDALRYQTYNQWRPDYIQALKAQISQSHWRFSYHIQPETGLLNDPNGFSYFNGQWHVFYQAFPFGPVHGLKSWYHLYSDNLVDWQRDQLRVLPDTPLDSHGVYSGSALPVDDQLFLAFTGNVRDENWDRHAYQLGAWMQPDFTVEKMTTPLIPAPPTGYTHHFRDPQIFTYNELFYMIIGAQNEQEEGKILLYRGTSVTNWTLVGELDFTTEQMGYMIECPNLVFVDNQPVLLFCPQGMPQTVCAYQNIYPNMYVTAEAFDEKTATLLQPSSLANLDEGFDVYATQAFQAPDGRTLSIGWVGLPDVSYPSDRENWAHCLTLVRELTMKNGQLRQTPVAEMTTLREEAMPITEQLATEVTLLAQPARNCYEMELIIPANTQSQFTLFADSANSRGFVITCDTKNGMIVVDRGQMTELVNPTYGTTRTTTLTPNTATTLRIFVDYSICEVFVNEGEKVLTSRVFSAESETSIFFKGSLTQATIWPLRPMKTN